MRITMPGLSRLRLPCPGWLLAALALAGLPGAIALASQGNLAEAGPWLPLAVAAALFDVMRLRAARRSPPGLITRDALAALFEREAATQPAVILCDLADTRRQLPAVLPQGAHAARWREDRLLILIPRPIDGMAVMTLARDLTMELAGGCHAGIAQGPRDGTRLDQLVEAAELALIETRRQGTTRYGFHAPGMAAAAAARRQALQRALGNALAGEGFRLDFQPIFAMATGALTGFEALIRLDHAELGTVAPSDFIPLAEETGCITEVGTWAVDEACRTAAQWPAHLIVAVNLSPAEFQSGQLVASIRRALQRHALPAYRLEIEITEGTLMTDSELVVSQLRLLRDMGVGVALDDFGIGYSSLSYLCRFPFSRLKIDRSFIADLDRRSAARSVLEAIVQLGHGLGMAVTAEGIETQRQITLLREIGCDRAQGYLLGRPAARDDLAGIILQEGAAALTRTPRPARCKAA